MKKEENINETVRLIKRVQFGTDLSNEKIKLPEKEIKMNKVIIYKGKLSEIIEEIKKEIKETNKSNDTI